VTSRVAVTSEHPAGTTWWMARGESEVPGTLTWLSRDEAERASGLRFTKRRTEYLLRRWVCKQAVAAAVGLPGDPSSLARIEVGNHPGGAPFVQVDREPLELDVSLTDRAGWGVCLVGKDLRRVGCDLEIVEPRSEGFVTDFLTPSEQALVGAGAADDRDCAVNLIWSAKESALKVLRTGLRRDTYSVEVVLDDLSTGLGSAPGWAPLEVRTAEGGRLPGWWRRDGAFLVTLASDRPFAPPVKLPGSVDLAGVHPVHSWTHRPLSP
jgi:4'-phosphopantetheinyl transferase